MIRRYFNKTISIFLTIIFLFGLFPPMVFAGPSSQYPAEITGINKTMFDNSFSKADKEINPERWLFEAKLGITQVINSWEHIVFGLYEDPLLLDEAKKSIEKWSNEELEARFSDWLIKRFFGEAAEKTFLEFTQALSETQKKYSWHLDSEGNVIFDDKTGDPLVIRPYEENRSFAEDITKWKNDVNNKINISNTSYKNIITQLFPELLAYIPHEMRESISSLISESISENNNAIKREFENIAAREERIFTSRRTRDIWSLRNKSENEAAKLFTERLLAETGERCRSGIDELNIKIEQAEAGVGDLALLGEEWLRLYKEQFEKGLKAWEDAEERFFIRRIEWEQDSIKLFSEGEEVWLAAFNQFEEERQKWELNAKNLLQTGETLFINLSEDLERNINEAKKEFELNMAVRIGEGTAKVKALIDMYLTCASTATSIKEAINFWIKQSNDAEIDLSDPNFSVWLSKLPNSFKRDSNIESLYSTYLSYMEKAIEAKEKIYKNYAELLTTGTLKDILSSDVSTEDFYLDEYQLALVRAKALVLYWERKTSISEAVIKYADDLSSNRMTEAEGIRAWEEAKNAYNKSLADYEIELKLLNERSSDIKNHQEILSELALNLQIEEKKLNSLYSDYNLLLSLSINNDSNIYHSILLEDYQNLVNEYRNFEKTGSESVYKDILINGLYWGITESKENPDINWQETLDPLVSLFNLYGFSCESYFLPDINEICELIFNKDGDFAENTAQFLTEFDKCFTILPNWLQTEINNWKNSFINYISVYAFYFDKKPEISVNQLLINQEELLQKYIQYNALLNTYENFDEINNEELKMLNDLYLAIIYERDFLNYILNITSILENFDTSLNRNNLHWRQSINNEYFDNIDYLVMNVSSWIEGILTDSFFDANYYTNRLNDAFVLYSQKDSIELTDNEPYYDIYLNEYSLAEDRYLYLLNSYIHILNSIKAYELTNSSLDEIIKATNLNISEKITQENIYNKVRDIYLKEADKFIEFGSLYDEQYAKLKYAFTQTELKKLEYEKQDAIQRWAGTSYINSNSEEYIENKENLKKAQVVLEVLTNLYSDEEKRVYEDPKYDELYSAYEKGFNTKITILNTIHSLSSSLSFEIQMNNLYFNNLQDFLYQLGSINQDYTNYDLPENRGSWTEQDIIMVKDGRLVFIRDEFNKLSGVDNSIADELNAYFNDKDILPDQKHEMSQFEIALRDLSERMLGYFSNSSRLNTWSLARNYLIKSLIDANGEISFLNGVYSNRGELEQGGSMSSQLVMQQYNSSKDNLYSVANTFGNDYNKSLDAWNSLSSEEKADLEFYTIITLINNSYSKGFSLYYTMTLYNFVYYYVNRNYQKAYSESNLWINRLFSFAWDEMKAVNSLTLSNISSPVNQTNASYNKWVNGLINVNKNINSNYYNYTLSCHNIDIMQNIKTDGEVIVWEDINNSLVTAKVKQNYIDEIKTYWETMKSEKSEANYYNTFDALSALFNWAENKENIDKIAFNNYCNEQIQAQQKNEIEFLSAVDNYFSGNIDTVAIKNIADKTYGKTAASQKKCYTDISALLLDDVSLLTDSKYEYLNIFSSLSNEFILLSKNTIEGRYLSEYAARESEWQLLQNDILRKYDEWQKTASIMLENGRLDWVTSSKKMEDAYKQWTVNFQIEYERINNEWNEIYLAGLEDKEKWLTQASNAANQASSEALLSLIGTEGERLSRFTDTREPLGIRDSIPKAQSLLNELLQSPGITSMTSAFNSLNSYTGITSPLVKRGMGGVSTWDSASVKIAASDMAKKSNSLIADNEAKVLAYNVKQSINEAINGLTANVKNANENFRENMDNLFIFKGLWMKNGDYYAKNVVKGSTLITPVITESVSIKGYENYQMESVKLKTNIDEYNLINLNSIAINSLVEKAYLEIRDITKEIFGSGEDSPGKFGTHIGKEPETKPNMGTNRNDMFSNEGSGQLGRLMVEFTYWKVIDTIGMGEVTTAPWDKRIWNDEGSNFKSPSLRSAGQIVGAVAAAVVSVVATPFTAGASLGVTVGMVALVAGISTTNDIVFNSLDAAYGYKTWDEAAFEIGKSSAINFTSGLITAGLSGFGDSIKGATNIAVGATKTTASTIATQTIMAGVQSYTTGLATSVLSGITYSSKDGLGYSGEIASAGIKNMLSGSLVSIASTLTTSGLTAINSGFDHLKTSQLIGFNNLNKSDLAKLNNLAGSLAGQGINYALGNDFTLNLLNFSLLSGNSSYNTGLLELHLGQNGTTMNFGTGGANVSIDNMAAVFRGAQVWNVNNRISSYGKKKDFDALVTLRAQYGYGDNLQKDQLFDILKGDVTLKTDENGDYSAQTTRDDNNNRVVTLAGYKSGMSTEDQFLLATTLGHEAYRDGYITNDNNIETRAATLAHTEMAIRIIKGGEDMTINENLINDITAYAAAYNAKDMSIFNNYVDNNYDSSADYWKLVINDNVASFIWDGKYTFDLTALGITESVDSLDDDILKKIQYLGHSSIEPKVFKESINSFYNLNTIAKSLEAVLIASALETSKNNDNKNTTSNTAVNNQIISFFNALQAVESSGMLLKTDPTVVSSSGNGPNIFASGNTIMTNKSGVRPVQTSGKYSFEEHTAWDLVNGDKKLVAPMSGDLSLYYNTSSGFSVITSGLNNQSISYSHSGSDSIKDIIGVFSSNGVTVNGNSLSGIAQNMIIGTMGNTGIYTTGAHVHLEYKVGGTLQDPSLFFQNASFQTTEYAKAMTGFNSKTLTNTEINGMLNYLNKNDKNATTTFFNYAKASNNYADFALAYLRSKGINP